MLGHLSDSHQTSPLNGVMFGTLTGLQKLFFMFYISSCLARSNKFGGSYIYDPVGLEGLLVIDFFY